MEPHLEALLEQLVRLPHDERSRLLAELDRRLTTGAPAAGEVLAGEAVARPDYRIIFDGGSRGNPGEGYGSYLLSSAAGEPLPVQRLRLGERVTNNEAEYDTLIAALEDLLARIGAAGRKADEFSVEVIGDSQLVMSQVEGTWRSRDERMRSRRNVVRQLLQQFRAARFITQPRERIVRVLGH